MPNLGSAGSKDLPSRILPPIASPLDTSPDTSSSKQPRARHKAANNTMSNERDLERIRHEESEASIAASLAAFQARKAASKTDKLLAVAEKLQAKYAPESLAPQTGRTKSNEPRSEPSGFIPGSSSSAVHSGSSRPPPGSPVSAGRVSPVKTAFSALTLSGSNMPADISGDVPLAGDNDPILFDDEDLVLSGDLTNIGHQGARAQPAAEEITTSSSLSDLDSLPPPTPEKQPRKRHSGKLLGRPPKKLKKEHTKKVLPVRVMAPNGVRFILPNALPAPTSNLLKETNMDMSSNHIEWREYSMMVERKDREVNNDHPACICCLVDGKRRGLCDIGSDPNHGCSRCSKERLPCAKMIEGEDGNYYAGFVPLRPEVRGHSQWREIGYWQTDEKTAESVKVPAPVTTKAVKSVAPTMGGTRPRRNPGRR